MKLAEALMLRADYQKRALQLRERILRNAKHQQGDKPAEDPKRLLMEYEEVSNQLEALIKKINITNTKVTLENDKLLVDALATRDILKMKHSLYNELAAQATPTQARYSKSEIKFVSAVKVFEIQSHADELAKQYRELDTLIQQANWNAELTD